MVVFGQHSHALDIVSQVLGWAYFVAWSASFYPQVYENWRRKSVVGLSFDFLAMNLLGFTAYAAFNISVLYVPSVHNQYLATHFVTSVPVKINDVVFAAHAVLLTFITIAQCFVYERGIQKASLFVALALLAMFASWVIVTIITVASFQQVTNWLFVVTWGSYLKVAVTFGKYVPQAYMNFSRKSTMGWSIGNVILDFSGGTLSLGQLFVDSINSGSWSGFTGDIAKTLLALLSIAFDILFMFQHYLCYPIHKDPKRREEGLLGDGKSKSGGKDELPIEYMSSGYDEERALLAAGEYDDDVRKIN